MYIMDIQDWIVDIYIGYEYLKFTIIVDIHNTVMDALMYIYIYP